MLRATNVPKKNRIKRAKGRPPYPLTLLKLPTLFSKGPLSLITRRSSQPPSPKWAVRLELGRAMWGLLRGLASLPAFWIEEQGIKQQVRDDVLAAPEAPQTCPVSDPPLHRPLKIFIACAEPSGEIHACSLARALQDELRELGAPPPELFGFGGPALAGAGVTLLGDPGARATMDAGEAARGIGFYSKLMERLARCCDEHSLDAFVPIDSPALHVPMASLAKERGVATIHFVAPQYWAWAPWRVGRYKRVMDLALTILPFEPRWYRRHGVKTSHVGHPILDTLGPLKDLPSQDSRTALVILPGSRVGEIEDNLGWMLARVREQLPRLECTEVLICQSSPRHRERIERILQSESVEAQLMIGDLHACLGRARTAFAVSGTVLMEVMHHRIPALVIYRVDHGWKKRASWLLTSPWFGKPNLVAGEEVFPEFGFVGQGDPEKVGAELVALDTDPTRRQAVSRGIQRAFSRLGATGAAKRAARAILHEVAPAEPKSENGKSP